MTYEEALQKAVKCLKLSQSQNASESALAASKAQEIIDRFKIDQSALELAANGGIQPDEPIKDFGFDPLERMRRSSTWKSRLASIIARLNSCKAYSNWNGPAVIGRASDVQTVRYLYGWLRQEVDRLAARDTRGNGRTWANEFRNGVVDTIRQKLDEQAKATREAVRRETELLAQQAGQSTTLALIKIDQAIARMEARRSSVEDWAKLHMQFTSGRSSYHQVNHSARQAGRMAGHEIRMRPAKASLS